MSIGPWWQQNPYSVQPLVSAARTATPTSVTVANSGSFNCCQILVSCTAATASPSVVFNFDVKNQKTGTYVEVLDGAAVTGISENIYQIGGVGSESTDLFTSFHPGAAIRVRPVHANTDSITYSVSVQWLRA